MLTPDYVIECPSRAELHAILTEINNVWPMGVVPRDVIEVHYDLVTYVPAEGLYLCELLVDEGR